MSILVHFHEKSRRSVPMWTPLLLTDSTAITDHLSGGEVPPGRGPLGSAAPVNIPKQFLVPGLVECGGRGVLSWAHSLALSKCSIYSYVAALFWADFQNCSSLLHTCQIPGEVNLHFVKARSKLNGPGSLWTSQTLVELGLTLNIQISALLAHDPLQSKFCIGFFTLIKIYFRTFRPDLFSSTWFLNFDRRNNIQ
jgi:hypothetical protein